MGPCSLQNPNQIFTHIHLFLKKYFPSHSKYAEYKSREIVKSIEFQMWRFHNFFGSIVTARRAKVTPNARMQL